MSSDTASWDSRQIFDSPGLGSRSVPEVSTRTGMPLGMEVLRITPIFSAKLLLGAPTVGAEAGKVWWAIEELNL